MKPLAIVILFLSSLIVPLQSISQVKKQPTRTEPPIPTVLKEIIYQDGKEVFYVCKKNPVINYKSDFSYFWYNEYSGVKSTEGSSGGQLLHGKYQMFDEDGDLKIEAHFYQGLKDGTMKIWNDDGSIKETYKYKKGTQVYSKLRSSDTTITNWIEWNGEVLKEGSIKKVYTSYGTLIQTEQCLKDFKFKITKYYYSGKIEKIYTTDFLDFMYDSYTEYYENGKMKTLGKFLDNLPTGEWKFFKEDGSLKSISKYRVHKEYYANGKEIVVGGEYFDKDLQDWISHGTWTYYSENGDFEKEIKFEYGELIEE